MTRTAPHPHNRRPRRLAAIVVTCALAGGGAVAVSVPAVAASSGFTAGDVVVYRTGTGASALASSGTPVFLDEFSPAGSSVQSVALPTTASGSNKPLVASGSAGSEGLLTLSGDGRYLVATGYDAAVGTAGLSSSTSSAVPRTIARVDATDTVDTSTALTDFSTGNNPRSAASADGSGFWVAGGAGGVRYAPLGASTSAQLTSTAVNLRQVNVVDGQLYVSGDSTKAGGTTVATVGSGLPTSGTQTVTNLVAAGTTPEPYGYSLLTLGSGSTPDTLYVGDQTNGSIAKYSLVNGTWTASGSVTLTGVDGVTANDVQGVVTIYATTSGGLYKITDSSGAGGTLSGSASQLVAAPTNEAFRGVAFAPGTTIGSGGAPPANPAPTITSASAGLPAALGDSTVPSTTLTVADTAYDASTLTVAATSSDQSIAADSGIGITGTGATRTLSVTPAGSTGKATITLTVTAPDGQTGSTTVAFGVSPDIGQSSARYYSGAGNASAAIDVGDGYAILGDDESNVLRLYDLNQSGPPVATFDFTSQLPFGTQEIDIEAAARSGNTIYWEGSMSNTSSGNSAPSRSTVFATTVSGTGANTTLTYVGAYTGLRQDLITWDESNGNTLGLAASAASGVGGHQSNALNLEGMEFAGSSNTLYLSFRAPLEPTTDRHLALLVPLTDIAADIAAGPSSTGVSTFGSPIELDLGGLGVRDIKENSSGQYLILAGTADDTNTGFVLYYWDGVAGDDPQPTGTTLPQLPSTDNAGSWETIVSVPDQLASGATVRLLQDDGTVDWYGDGLDTKDGELPALQKSVGVTFGYAPPSARASTTTLAQDSSSAAAGTSVTYTATVAPASGNGTPTGTVDFGDGGVDVSGCSAQPLTAGTATCTITYTVTGTHSVSAAYSGDGTYSGSSSGVLSHAVTAAAATALMLSPSSTSVTAGAGQTYTAEGVDRYGNDTGDVTASTTFSIAPDTTGSAAGASCDGSSCSADVVGSYTVTGKDGSATGTAELDVVAGQVAALTLSPADDSTPAGTAVDYTARGADAQGNDTGVDHDATFMITPASGGSADGASCTAASCGAEVAGSYTVTATDGTADGTASLTIVAGPLAVLTLSPHSAVVPSGGSQAYSATGADRYGNSLGDLTTQTMFTIDGVGTCSANVCSPGRGMHTVTGTDGSVTGTAGLSATPPAPIVTSVSPTSGPSTGGTRVTIIGTGFDHATHVAFGRVAATMLTVVSDTRIRAVSPAHSAGALDVSVTTTTGRSTARRADRFTYVPAPTIARISPASGRAAGGTRVTITGADFSHATDVLFGSRSARSFRVVSATKIVAIAPRGHRGRVAVTIVTPGGRTSGSRRARFTYT